MPRCDPVFPQRQFRDTRGTLRCMNFTEADLLAYLDEALPPERAAEVERAARESAALRQRLSLLLERRDQGGHTVGEIWRRKQLSCLSRTDLSRYLSGQLPEGDRDYVEFHTGVVHCPVCTSNLEDLRQMSQEIPEAQDQRRRKFFESSAGRLQKRPDDVDWASGS